MAVDNLVIIRIGLHIAHRMNNDLSALNTFTDFLVEDLSADHPQHAMALKVRAGAQACSQGMQILHKIFMVVRDDGGLDLLTAVLLVQSMITEPERDLIKFHVTDPQSGILKQPLEFIDAILQIVDKVKEKPTTVEINVNGQDGYALADGRKVKLNLIDGFQTTTVASARRQ
jgi:hypothetical protein